MNLSNLIGNFNDGTSFSHKKLLTDITVSNIHKVFGNGSSGNIKFSKTQLSKMIKSGGYIGRYNPISPATPIEVLSKTANKPKDLSKEETHNDIIKTVDFSKKFINNLKKVSGRGITPRNS